MHHIYLYTCYLENSLWLTLAQAIRHTDTVSRSEELAYTWRTAWESALNKLFPTRYLWTLRPGDLTYVRNLHMTWIHNWGVPLYTVLFVMELRSPPDAGIQGLEDSKLHLIRGHMTDTYLGHNCQTAQRKPKNQARTTLTARLKSQNKLLPPSWRLSALSNVKQLIVAGGVATDKWWYSQHFWWQGWKFLCGTAKRITGWSSAITYSKADNIRHSQQMLSRLKTQMDKEHAEAMSKVSADMDKLTNSIADRFSLLPAWSASATANNVAAPMVGGDRQPKDPLQVHSMYSGHDQQPVYH